MTKKTEIKLDRLYLKHQILVMYNTNEEALIAIAENENAANVTNTIIQEDRYDIYWDRNGKEIYRTLNNQAKDRTFIVKTSDSRETIYGENLKKNPKMCALVQNIPENIAKETENQIKAGNVNQNDHNIVEIVNIDILYQMLKVVKNDNSKSGLSDSNNREYGGTFSTDSDTIADVLQGKVGNPETDPYAFIEFTIRHNTRCTFHSHPSGAIKKYYINEKEYSYNDYTEKKKNLQSGSTAEKTYNWQQPPSSVDTEDITTTNYVFSMADKSRNVYVYDSSGILAHFLQNVISHFYEELQKGEKAELKNRQKEEKNNPINKSKEKKEMLKEKQNKENAELNERHVNENATTSIP